MTAWTCPFCALLCDRFTLEATAGNTLRLGGSDCPRATRALAHFDLEPANVRPRVDGKPVLIDEAIAAAATLLDQARQPLFGGLATDIAGTRALYTLANRCHAILDHANSAGLLPGLRTLQDRGVLQTTLAEVRNRADLLLVIGTQPARDYPEFYRRCGLGDEVSPLRDVVFLGAPVDPALAGLARIAARSIDWVGDAYDTLALLNALCSRKRITAPALLVELAERMLAAKYVVVVWEPGKLPGSHPALLVESINLCAKTVNRTTRAGGLALAGNDGGLAVNQTLGWMSGLPLRTGVLASGLQHDPHRYASDRLLADRAVDALLWVASFGPDNAPAAADAFSAVPSIVMAHPAFAERAAAARVFIPVATPGIGADGHLFRLDGVVVVPVHKVRDDPLPTVANITGRIDARLLRSRAEAA
jgi:formylmethanofuran dehydrogenase subunit B